jgi:hypothetical protein
MKKPAYYPICICLFLLPLLALNTCADAKAGDPPVDLEELAPLMADLQLAEALTGEIPILVRDSMREVYYDNILEEYGKDRATFDSLLWLVRQEPVWIDSLYSKIGVILTRRQTELEAGRGGDKKPD